MAVCLGERRGAVLFEELNLDFKKLLEYAARCSSVQQSPPSAVDAYLIFSDESCCIGTVACIGNCISAGDDIGKVATLAMRRANECDRGKHLHCLLLISMSSNILSAW